MPEHLLENMPSPAGKPKPKHAAAAKMLSDMASRMGELASDADKLLDILDLRREMKPKEEDKEKPLAGEEEEMPDMDEEAAA